MRAIRSKWNDLDTSTQRYLAIAGIIVGSAALLTYPAILLYKRMQARKASRMEMENMEEETHDTKSFAPNYLGKHKPHHRKATAANGHLHN